MNNFNIKISQESEIASSGSYKVSGDGSDITIQRVIYNNLKSLVNNTNVSLAGTGKGDGYYQFLEDMSILHNIMYNKSTEDIPAGIENVNQYLGQLGMDQKYPLKRDIIQLNKFLNADYLDLTPTP